MIVAGLGHAQVVLSVHRLVAGVAGVYVFSNNLTTACYQLHAYNVEAVVALLILEVDGAIAALLKLNRALSHQQMLYYRAVLFIILLAVYGVEALRYGKHAAEHAGSPSLCAPAALLSTTVLAHCHDGHRGLQTHEQFVRYHHGAVGGVAGDSGNATLSCGNHLQGSDARKSNGILATLNLVFLTQVVRAVTQHGAPLYLKAIIRSRKCSTDALARLLSRCGQALFCLQFAYHGLGGRHVGGAQLCAVS